MLRCNSQVLVDPATDSDATLKFLNSLKELRELRSQIHNAADYCESAFKTSQEKRTVLDNTREYICRAVVSVVDHVGCVSANLESTISESDTLSEADLRITCLKQKVSLHGECNHTLVMSKLSPRVLLPRHFSRYLLPPQANPNQDKPEEQSGREVESCDDGDEDSISTKKSKAGEQRIDEELPLFMYTNTNNIPLYRSPSMSDADFNTLQSLTSVLPVRDGLSIPQESKRAPFHFQMVRKHGRKILQWRIQDKSIVSLLIRRSKKESLKFLKS